MIVEIGKRYNIKTKELNYINYLIIGIGKHTLQIHSLDGCFNIGIDEITDIEKLNIFQCLTTMPKRTKEISLPKENKINIKKENKDEGLFKTKTVYYKPTEEREQENE